MKTLSDLIKENIKELSIRDIINLENTITEVKQTLINKITKTLADNEYLARKYLMNEGFTHAEACEFINKYIHQNI